MASEKKSASHKSVKKKTVKKKTSGSAVKSNASPVKRRRMMRIIPESPKFRIEKDQAEIKKQAESSLELAKAVYRYLDEKKAREIKILNLEKVNPYFGYFVIASADSSLQLKAYARDLRKMFGHLMINKGSNPREDDVSSGWVVLDFFDVIVHLFLKEERSYYNLERLWGDAPEIKAD